jgi:hypothetical protein
MTSPGREERRYRALLVATALAPTALLAAAGVTSPASAAPAPVEATTGGASLTGTFQVRAVYNGHPKQVFKTVWGFAPMCDSGACNTSISTVETLCSNTINCEILQGEMSFAQETLHYVSGTYRATFPTLSGCYSNGTYWPYAYNQTTTVVVRPTAATGTGGARTVSKIAGTVTEKGHPGTGGKAQGCRAWSWKLSVTGATEAS